MELPRAGETNKELINWFKIPFVGQSCSSGELTVCQKYITDKISGINYVAKVCNDGKMEITKVPVEFMAPKKKYKVCLCLEVK